MNTSPSIFCSNIDFAYGKARAPVYTGFSRNYVGGVTMLKGYSGSGKTTLLKLIGGLLFPQRGTIETSWRRDVRDPEYLRLDTGFCFQGMNLLPLATVRRNLEIAGALAGMSRRDIGERGDALLSRVGILKYANTRPSELSGGQQKRATIARALLKSPRVLLLDEPTSDLDDGNTDAIKAILDELPDDVICLMSSHDSRMESVCDEVFNLGTEGGAK